MRSSELIKKRIGNAKCAVLGLGVSNIPLVELLLECGNEITVYDKNSFEKLGPRAEEFLQRGVTFITGEGYLDRIDGDIIFRSPGIRPDHPGIVEAVSAGAELTSEMELFIELTPAKIFAVTGSDGKTTTTTVAYKLLEHEYEGTIRKIYVGGNIGTPLLSKVGEMTENDICVLELSSFQLFTMKKSPECAVITNVSPNHLDWHEDMMEYVDAKTNIFKHGAKTLVTNANDEICMALCENCNCEIRLFSAHLELEKMLQEAPEATGCMVLAQGDVYYSKNRSALRLFSSVRLRVPGKHNVENFMAAILLVWDYISEKSVKHVVRTFNGVEHRLEFVRMFEDVAYFNSSIDSSPSRTAAALSAFEYLGGYPIVICGGYDKNIPFAPLAKALDKKAKAVILTGATAEKIKEALVDEMAELDIYIEKDFDTAIHLARSIAQPFDIVLLSPACASFDAFKNFMERGNRFKQIVNDFK